MNLPLRADFQERYSNAYGASCIRGKVVLIFHGGRRDGLVTTLQPQSRRSWLPMFRFCTETMDYSLSFEENTLVIVANARRT
ncbi:uncharacterized protein LOC131322981 isoform X3 [Rhododendron vialii]|uniref:uncharacterized protein LOC131322981 isoform X3 n=1 Tax=Rhododendron vialii TaxID=182163 RepID=UPI00265E57DA|nr:uncharacterized protein LOC131322981 isoform X3 [Rhododendron vialii]